MNNQLIIMSDEHTRSVLRCYGNEMIATPNLDKLAARGTLFTNAYTPVPICVPARAAFATGQYCHQTAHWDNAFPYTGRPESWAHVLRHLGIQCGSIGKLHYRSEQDDTGFSFQHLPMHVVNGVGDVLGSVRDPLPVRQKGLNMARQIGAGETSYTAYDRDIAHSTAEWLKSEGTRKEPFVLFASLVCPHFPLVAPEEYYQQYANLDLKPKKHQSIDKQHRWLREMHNCLNMKGFTDESTHIALTAYYGLVTFMDEQVGLMIDAVEEAGLTDYTQIYYTSDHGDNIGERGWWGKSNMYEESAGIPLIAAGPDIPQGHVCETPVSLLDFHPTVLQNAGVTDADGAAGPGKSLLDIAAQPTDIERVVMSEYHAMGSPSAAFMIRQGPWKLVHYVGYEPQLFNLLEDPDEHLDRGSDPDFSNIRENLTNELHKICDPHAVNRDAFVDQKTLVESHGGIEAVVARGGFGATPPPGDKPVFA